MILADKIINERKKRGWSQEELAEQLSVSRQSVSKWEGAQAVPDLQKIIAMADIFGVSTDYLIKDEFGEEDLRPAQNPTLEESKSRLDIRKVTLEEANKYIELVKKNAPSIANGVTLCILSPALLILLLGLSEEAKFGISEGLALGIGMVALFVFISIAVIMFIFADGKVSEYKFLETEDFETAYGVNSYAEEIKRRLESRRVLFTAVGTILCIISPVPIIIAGVAESSDYMVVVFVAVLLVIVSAAVNLFVRVYTITGACDKLLQREDYSPSAKKAQKNVEKIAAVYWSLVTAGFLGWSFITNDWGRSWIIWPVAAVLFIPVQSILKLFANKDD